MTNEMKIVKIINNNKRTCCFSLFIRHNKKKISKGRKLPSIKNQRSCRRRFQTCNFCSDFWTPFERHCRSRRILVRRGRRRRAGSGRKFRFVWGFFEGRARFLDLEFRHVVLPGDLGLFDLLWVSAVESNASFLELVGNQQADLVLCDGKGLLVLPRAEKVNVVDRILFLHGVVDFQIVNDQIVRAQLGIFVLTICNVLLIDLKKKKKKFFFDCSHSEGKKEKERNWPNLERV